MQQDQRRTLRHDFRGKWSALCLCLTALELSDTPSEKVEMIDLLLHSAEELEGVVDQFLQLPDAPAPSSTPPAG